MLISFCLIFFLLTLFLSLGFFFQRYLINTKLSDHFSFFETIFFGIFLLTILTLLTNFFLNLHNKFFLIFLFFLFSFTLLKFRKLIKNNIKKILLIALIFSPLSTYISFGYDSGLYHIPYQAFIQSEKISFGLANLHMRYGLTTSYSYIAALLWYNNFFNLVSSFSTILFSLFFIFVYERIKTKNVIDNIFAISALITFPLWYRYAELSIALVDTYYSIFCYFTVYYGVKIILSENNYEKKINNKIFLFLIFLSFTISTKPTASLLILFLLFVLIIKYKLFLKDVLNIIKINIISLLFFLTWIIRNFIISSCFFYPIKLSCLNFSWQTNSIEDITVSIKIWNSFIFNSFLKFVVSYELLIIVLVVIFLILLINSKRILNFLLLNRKLAFLTLTLIFVISTMYIEPLKLVSYLIQSKQNILLKTIYIKEVIFIFLFYTLAIFFVSLTFTKNITLNKFFNIRFSNFSPFLFFFINFLIWILYSPHPRLGQNLFLLIIPVIVILLVDLKKVTIYDFSKYFNILIIIILFKISIIQNFSQINSSSIIFVKKFTPEVALQKRNFYGYFPQNSENLCWTKKNCHPYSDVHIYKEILNYKFFKEIKN